MDTVFGKKDSTELYLKIFDESKLKKDIPSDSEYIKKIEMVITSHLEEISSAHEIKELATLRRNLIKLKKIIKKQGTERNNAFLTAVTRLLKQVEDVVATESKGCQKTFSEELRKLQLISDIKPPALPEVLPLPALSANLFFHINGDAFGDGAGLEGGFPKESFIWLNRFINDKFSNNPIYETILKEMKYISANEEWIDFIVRSGNFNAIPEYIEKFLKPCLALGPIVLPGGWPTHAVLYEIIPSEKAGFCTFRIYNTGEGIDNHPSCEVGKKKKYRAFIEKCNVPLEDVLNEKFIQSLIEINRFSTSQQPNQAYTYIDTEFGEYEVYEGLLGMLRGELGPPDYNLEELMGAQRAGTCSWKSICAWLKKQLPLKEFKTLKYEIKKNSLLQFMKENPFLFDLNHKMDEEERAKSINLLKKSCSKFARNALKMKKESWLSPKEFNSAKDVITDIAKKIDLFNEQSDANKVSKAIELQFNENLFPALPCDDKFRTFLKDIASSNLSAKKIEPKAEKEALSTLQVDLWNVNSATIQTDLTKFSDSIDSAFTAKQYASVVDCVNAIMTKIPMPSNNEFWANVSNADQQAVKSIVSNIADKLFRSSFFLPDSSRTRSEGFYSTAKAAALISILGEVKKGEEISTYNWISLVIERNEEFTLKNPQQARELEELLNFFEKGNKRCKFYIAQNNQDCELFSVTNISIPTRINSFSELEYLDRAIHTDKELISKLEAKYLGFQNKSRIEKLAVAYKDEEILPLYYLQMRNIVLILKHFATQSFFKPANAMPEEIEFEFKSKQISDLGFSFSQHLKMNEKVNQDFITSQKNIRRGYFKGNRPIFQIRQIESGYHFIEKQKGVKLTENRSIFALQPLFKSICPEGVFDRETLLEINFLRTQDEDQIFHTLSYFLKDLKKLDGVDYRTILDWLIFDKNLLGKALKDNGYLSTKLADFIQQGYKRAKNLGNFDSAIYFLKLGRTFKQYMEPNLSSTTIPDLATECRELLRIPNISVNQQAALYHGLLLSYARHKNLDNHSLQEILTCQAFLSDHPLSPTHIPAEEIDQIDQIIRRFQEPIKKYQLQMGGAVITNFADTIKALPAAILKDPTYQRLLGQEYSATQIDNNIYQLKDKNGRLWRIINNGNNNFSFQKEIENKFYQYLPRSTILKKTDKKPPQTPEITSLLRARGISDLHDHWMRCDGEAVGAVQILICNSGEDTIKYQWILQKNSSLPRIEKNRKGQPLSLGTLKPQGSSLTALFQFENCDFINFWKNKEGKLTEIELPRFNLSFDVVEKNNKLVANCDKFNGFHLAAKQSIQGLPNFNNYLVLENDAGHKKILIPNFTPALRPKQSLNPCLHLDFHLESDQKGESYFSYDIDPKTNQPHSKQIAANLFLATIFFGTQRYEEAYRFIEKHCKKTAAYTEKERHLLLQAITLVEKNSDHDPAALALRIKLALIYLENEGESQTLGKEERGGAYKKVVDVLAVESRKYNNQLNNVEGLHLTSHDEEKISSYIELSRSLSQGNGRGGKGTDNDSRPLNTKVKLIYSDILNEAFNSPEGQQTLFTRPGDKFVKDFAKNYKIAKTGTPEEKRNLSNSLRFVVKDSYEELVKIAEILQMVLLVPDRFELENLDDLFVHDGEKWVLNRELYNKKLLAPLNEYEKEQKNLPQDKLKSTVDGPASVIQPKFHKKNPPLAAESKVELSFILPKEEVSDTAKRYKTDFKKRFILTTSEQENIKKNHFEIHNMLGRHRQHGIAEQEFQRLQNDCQGYYDQKLNSRQKEYKLELDADKLKEFNHTLCLEIQDRTEKLNEQEIALLRFANYHNTGIVNRMSHMAKTLPIAALDDLLAAFATKNQESYLKYNPALSAKDLLLLNNMVGEYVQSCIQVQRMERGEKTLEELCRISDPSTCPETSETIQQQHDLTARLYRELYGKREYEAAHHPAYLVFELYADLLLMENQVKQLDTYLLSGKDCPIRQMIMGSGKTTVLLRLLGLLRADGHNLSMVVLPEALYASSADPLRQDVYGAFKQQVQSFEFDRNTPLNATSLLLMKNKLLQAIEQRECLVTTSKSLQCFFDRYIQQELDFSADPNPAKERSTLLTMREIMKIFSDQGNSLIDEADTILNCRHEVNFALGAALPIKPERLDFVKELYLLAMKAPCMKGCGLDFLHPDTKSNSPYTGNLFKDALFPVLLKGVLTIFKTKALGNDPQKVVKFFESLSKEQEKLLEDFLSGKSSKEIDLFIATIPEEEIRDLVCLTKEEINSTLPLTLGRIYNVNYGLSSKDLWLAKPFLGAGVPNPTSQFGNIYELAHYTIQAHLHKGIQPQLIEEYVSELRKSALDQMSEGFDLDKTEANKLFLELTKGDSKFSLFQMDQAKFADLAVIINQNFEQKMQFLRTVILPKIQIYPAKISCNAQNLISMTYKAMGFSGTLWNSKTFHPSLDSQADLGVDGKTVFLLWEKCPSVVRCLQEDSVLALCKQAVIGFDALIDCGGLLRGAADNESVARQILESSPHLQGVVFYDKNDQQMVLERDSKKVVPLEESEVGISQRFVIFDQRHTTGADIKQQGNAKALVTIGKQVFLRDIFQAVWRMRQLDKGQNIEFIITNEVKKIINEKLSKGENDEVSLSDLLQFAVANQGEQQGEDNRLALTQKLKDIIQMKVIQILIDPNVEEKQKNVLAQKAAKFFLFSTEDEPYQQSGKSERLEEAKIVIDEEVANFKDEVNLLYKSCPILLEKFSKEQLEGSISKAIDIKTLNEKISTKSPLLQDIQVEVEVEKLQLQLQAERSRSLGGKAKQSDMEVEVEQTKEMNVQKQVQHDAFEGGAKHSPPIYWIGQIESNSWKVGRPFPLSVKVKEFLNRFPDLQAFSNSIDEGVMASANFFVTLESDNEDPKPFSLGQKISRKYCGRFNKNTGQTELYLFDDFDRIAFSDIAAARDTLKDERDRNSDIIYLFDPILGVTQGCQDSVTTEELRKNKSWLRQLVQAKFLNGELFYPKIEERQALREWLQECPAEANKVFKIILQNRPNLARAAQTSFLQRLLDELDKRSDSC